MLNKILKHISLKNIASVLSVIIIVTGVALRLAEWIHARDLMMDEVNVVRNIYERGFIDLLKPLYYEQFAPPIFLWIIKFSSILFGFGEMSLRFPPILFSCVSLWLMYKLLRVYGVKYSMWYPLALLAFSTIYLKYGNDVKQYSSDALIAILLLLLMIKYPIKNENKKKQFLFWALIGFISIWTSMPCVFVLAAVGTFFFINSIMNKNYDVIVLIISIGFVWVVSFFIYYFLLLRHQIASDYLQSFHEQYFLQIHQISDFNSEHNIQLIKNLVFEAIGNDNILCYRFNLILFFLGVIFIFKKNIAFGTSILIPFLCLFVISTFHAFTLIPRVCIFILPVFLFVIGCGLEGAIMLLKWFSIPIIVFGIFVAVKSQRLDLFNVNNKIEFDELTKEVSFATSYGVPYNQIFVPFLYEPCWIYYSSIHPDKKRRKDYKNIQVLKNDDNFKEVRNKIKGRAAFVYFWIDDYTKNLHRDSIINFLKPVDSMIKPSYKVFVYEK